MTSPRLGKKPSCTGFGKGNPVTGEGLVLDPMGHAHGAGNWHGRPGNRQMDRTEQAPVIKNNFSQGSQALVFSSQLQDYTPTSLQGCRNPLLIIILTYGEKNPSISQVIQGPFCSDKECLWAGDMAEGHGG